ncbi:YeeE/YedE family protein [Pseudohongiella sp.]|uniref:Uncharacterized protein n=1 Tax=marine sediment metagenome TaxID=412755 RepID=A0A0F9W7K9_9ZZZZ|nr:YeeE/YedE family protein [Pseudohongiella sp.]
MMLANARTGTLTEPLIVRAGLALLMLAIVFITFAIAGPRSALLMLTGLGFGLVLEGLRFGFAGPWRQMLTERDCRGLVTQFMAIGLFALVAFPLLANAPEELAGAHAPVGLAMIAGAFVFGAAMQVVLGCGSGVLVNAGSGNLVAVLALPGFIAGSFVGSLHLEWWTALGSLPVLSLQGLFGAGPGLWLTLFGLLLLASVAIARAVPGKRLPGARLRWAAVLVAALAVLNLVIAGQSWGVVYGLGLWGAKTAQAAGMEVAATGFWAAAGNAQRLEQSLLTDVTSLTNIGILAGAFIVMQWRRAAGTGQANAQVRLPRHFLWLVMLVAGLVLGYSARIAFGCNVGAYFSGIATGSVHGWVWFLAAFVGAALGIRLRNRLFSVGAEPGAHNTPASVLAPGRPAAAMAAIALVLALLLIDYRVSVAINPFAAPPPTAYGSGLAPTGGHCTQL